MNNPKLTIEMIPKTSWFTNLRSELTAPQWDFVRRATYKQASYRCEICNGKGNKHPVECHETWEYDDVKNIQTLTGLIALCPSCHRVKHAGLALLKGQINGVIFQLAKVNEWGMSEAEDYIFAAFDIHRERSRYQWTVDISKLKQLVGEAI